MSNAVLFEKVPKAKNFLLFELLKEWALKSTFHGLKNLVSSEFILVKIIWIVSLMASFSFFHSKSLTYI